MRQNFGLNFWSQKPNTRLIGSGWRLADGCLRVVIERTSNGHRVCLQIRLFDDCFIGLLAAKEAKLLHARTGRPRTIFKSVWSAKVVTRNERNAHAKFSELWVMSHRCTSSAVFWLHSTNSSPSSAAAGFRVDHCLGKRNWKKTFHWTTKFECTSSASGVFSRGDQKAFLF